MNKIEINDMIDSLIDEEAKRIIDILIEMYKKNEKTTKIFNLLVYDLMKDEFKLYEFYVMRRVVEFIPSNLTISLEKGKIFISNEESSTKENKVVYRQTNTTLKKDIIEKIVKEIKNNNLKYQNKNILQIIYQNISKKDLINLESKDITYIIKNIINNLEKDFYINSVQHFSIQQKK